MPLYPVKNLKTGEQKEIHMLVEDYEKWREENPDWDKDWSKGVAGFRTRSSDWYTSDQIANPVAYEDKNNSLANPAPNGTATGPNNSLVEEHFRMK